MQKVEAESTVAAPVQSVRDIAESVSLVTDSS